MAQSAGYCARMSDDADDDNRVPVQFGEAIVRVHPDRVAIVRELMRLDLSVFDAVLEEDEGRVGLVFGDGDDPCFLLDFIYDEAKPALREAMTEWAMTGTISCDEEEGVFVTHFLWIRVEDEQAVTEILSRIDAATFLMALSPTPKSGPNSPN